MSDRDAVRRRMEQDGIEFILVQFVDLTGAAKAKMIPLASFDEAVEVGVGFAGAAVTGMGQGPHSHEMLARVDVDSFTPVPWQPGLARFAADLWVDGEPSPYCPRVNLKRCLTDLRADGYLFNVGMEPEHFLVVRRDDGTIEAWDPDQVDTLAKPCYDYRCMAPATGYLQELMLVLDAVGWGVYQADHEDGNGQFEVNFAYTDALATADRIVFFRMAASQLARRHGAIATFMPKPFADRTGSGLHAHYHLCDAEGGGDLFRDEGDARDLGCSSLAYRFIGGILRHARALCAVTCPTVNCYKRLKVGSESVRGRSGCSWTPAFVSYGDNNRTQMIRIAGPGNVEDRTISSACNPYLALAASAAAGHDGIRTGADPGEPSLGNSYEHSRASLQDRGIDLLPRSLSEAMVALRNDDVIRGALGPIADELLRVQANEWDAYSREVTEWEIGSYLTAW